jgi:hypothetical protein
VLRIVFAGREWLAIDAENRQRVLIQLTEGINVDLTKIKHGYFDDIPTSYFCTLTENDIKNLGGFHWLSFRLLSSEEDKKYFEYDECDQYEKSKKEFYNDDSYYTSKPYQKIHADGVWEYTLRHYSGRFYSSAQHDDFPETNRIAKCISTTLPASGIVHPVTWINVNNMTLCVKDS